MRICDWKQWQKMEEMEVLRFSVYSLSYSSDNKNKHQTAHPVTEEKLKSVWVGRLSAVYVMEKSWLEVTEHVEAKLIFPERKLRIHFCHLGMLLGNINLSLSVLGHWHHGSSRVPGLDKKPEPQLPNVTLMKYFIQSYLRRNWAKLSSVCGLSWDNRQIETGYGFSPCRNLCFPFWQGNHYVFTDASTAGKNRNLFS